MATSAFRALSQKEKRTVGNIVSTSKYVKDVANGALFTEDVENFHLVEIEYDADGVLVAKALTDVTKKAYLVAAPERRYLGENIGEFFVGEGERARILYTTEGLIFDASAYELDGTVTEIKAGQKAHYNVATKKYLIHDGSHADFANASVQLTVKSSEDNLEYTLGQPMVRFVIEQ